ncbi:MAG: hypothetical protein R3E58_04050 [Phycisphaerae bacterium]
MYTVFGGIQQCPLRIGLKPSLAELNDDPGFSDDLGAVMNRCKPTINWIWVLELRSVITSTHRTSPAVCRFRFQTDANCDFAPVNTHVWGLFLVTGLDKVFTFFDDGFDPV